MAREHLAYGILKLMKKGGPLSFVGFIPLGMRKSFGRIKHTRKSPPGFTILETMIVLAVTGGLFVVFATTLSGRQNKAEFNHAIQNVQVQIQQVINQVSTGFYPNDGSFTCTNSGGNMVFDSAANNQGTNEGCTFLGKVMQFGPGVNGTDPEQFIVYTIAGLRCPPSPTGGCLASGATSPFSNISPSVVSIGNSVGQYKQYADIKTLQYGLTTKWIRSDRNPVCAAQACSIGSVGILMEPGTSDTSSTNGYISGTQQVDLIPIVSSPIPTDYTSKLVDDIPTGVSHIEGSLRATNLTAAAPINPVSGVWICFASGGTNQSGLITIGGSGRQLLVKLDIKNGTNCT